MPCEPLVAEIDIGADVTKESLTKTLIVTLSSSFVSAVSAIAFISGVISSLLIFWSWAIYSMIFEVYPESISSETEPSAIVKISVWSVVVAKLKIEFVKSWEDLTSITGINPDKAVTVLFLFSSSSETPFEFVMLFRTFSTKLDVSISTFWEVVAYSKSISSAIDLK